MVDLLRLPGRHTLNQASKLIVARTWLENSKVTKSWLVILDITNEETAATLGNFLPRHDRRGRILITARTVTITERYTASEELFQLSLYSPGIDNAVAMLLAGANLKREGKEEAERGDVERLTRSVGSLPLAID